MVGGLDGCFDGAFSIAEPRWRNRARRCALDGAAGFDGEASTVGLRRRGLQGAASMGGLDGGALRGQ